MIKSLGKLWLKLRVSWSNIRNRDNLGDCVVIKDKVTPSDIYKFAEDHYCDFVYKYDSATELFDSMRFPAQCYKELVIDQKLEDDCDGWSAAMYHLAVKNGFVPYVLSYVTSKVTKSHSVLVFKYGVGYYLIDYDNWGKFKKFDSIIESLEMKYKTEILCYNLVEFDYENKKWVIKEGDI